MKKHGGMRPQDITILLAIMMKSDAHWMMKDLAHELGISRHQRFRSARIPPQVLRGRAD